MASLEVIGDPVVVCAHFRRGRISPVWFAWKGRRYQVEEIRNRWVTQEGLGRRYHFAVTVEECADLYELHLRSETMGWYLGRIDVSG
jgi:galactose mutarotase-like enzyme